MVFWRPGRRVSAAAGKERPIAEKLNILFTCAGRRVALLEAFRRARDELGLGGRLLATDATAASAAYHKADAGFTVPRCDDPDYLMVLREIVRREGVGLLVPLTDLDLLLLAQRREEFAHLGCTVMIGGEEAVRICRDKAATAAHIAATGLPALRTVPLADFQREPFYPAFVKPVSGSASVGARVIGSAEELDAHVGRYGEALVAQELAGGREYTIDVYRSRSGQVCTVVPRQRLSVRAGEVEKGVTVKDPVLIDHARRLAESLDLWGAFCCQCRCHGELAGGQEREPKFFEVNPRFGGGAPLSIAAGANLPRMLLEDVLGRPVAPAIGQFQENLLMLRYDSAAFLPVEDRTALPGFDSPQFR